MNQCSILVDKRVVGIRPLDIIIDAQIIIGRQRFIDRYSISLLLGTSLLIEILIDI